MYACLFLQEACPPAIQKIGQNWSRPATLVRHMEEELNKTQTVFKICQEEEKGLGSRVLDMLSPIKPKMFTKITGWMQKLSEETLGFSSETLEISIRILIRFLNIREITSKQLQMLGCVCLHLASKINENTIIAIESYIDCCLGIFDKQQFSQLEIQVYEALNYSLQPTLNLHQLIYFTCSQILKLEMHTQVQGKVCSLIKEIIKDLQFTKFSRIRICCCILVALGLDQSKELTKDELLAALRQNE